MSIVASIDIGLKRVGIALLLNKVAVPQNAFIRKNREQVANDISVFLKEWKVDILVVGIPIGFSAEDEMRRRIKHFVSLIDFSGRIDFIDESFSSFEAKESMKGNTKSKRDGRIDSISAKIILDRWIEGVGNVSI